MNGEGTAEGVDEGVDGKLGAGVTNMGGVVGRPVVADGVGGSDGTGLTSDEVLMGRSSRTATKSLTPVLTPLQLP